MQATTSAKPKWIGFCSAATQLCASAFSGEWESNSQAEHVPFRLDWSKKSGKAGGWFRQKVIMLERRGGLGGPSYMQSRITNLEHPRALQAMAMYNEAAQYILEVGAKKGSTSVAVMDRRGRRTLLVDLEGSLWREHISFVGLSGLLPVGHDIYERVVVSRLWLKAQMKLGTTAIPKVEEKGSPKRRVPPAPGTPPSHTSALSGDKAPHGPIDPDRSYDPKEAAALIGHSPKTLEKWRYNKEGPEFYKSGKRSVRYRGAAILAWRIAGSKRG
jgi:hypothetical protein